MKRHLVSYHYPCPDGIFAALAARQHFAEKGIQRVHYLPNKVFAPISLQDLALTVSLNVLHKILPCAVCNFVGLLLSYTLVSTHDSLIFFY